MKYAFALLIYMLAGTACDSEGQRLSHDESNVDENDERMKNKITIKVGDKTFTATLFDNASAKALRSMLPLTIDMTELNGNEKYFRFSKDLPTNPSHPDTINAGDLMLWGSNTLVLFYETFSTSYSYTKIGRIDDPTGLGGALGSGSASVAFELE